MSLGRLDRTAIAVAVLLLVGVWLRHDGTQAAFAVTTSTSGSTVTAAPDWRPPVIGRATALKSEGGVTGYLRTGGSYTVLAQVDDDASSKPPAGVGTVRTDVSSLTTSATAVSLSAASVSASGQTYNWQSVARTVSTGRAAGTYSPTVTASDAAAPPNTSAAFPFTAVVDNSAPVPASMTATNGAGTAGTVDGGDKLTYTWTEASGIDPDSISSGWTGAALAVTVAFQNINKNDILTITDAGTGVQLPLGSVGLGGNWVKANLTFTGTMTWSATTPNQVVVTIGSTSTPGSLVNTTTSTSRTWTPSASVYDWAGNPSTTTAVNATGRNF